MEWLTGFRSLRLDRKLCSFAVWEEALDEFGNRDSAEARKPCRCPVEVQV